MRDLIDRHPLLALGVLAGVGYGLYRLARAGFDAVQQAAAVVTEPIAEGYVRVTSGPGAEVVGNAVLPSGRLVPLSTLAIDSNFRFIWGGAVYELRAHDASGNYPAVLVTT